VNRPTSIRTVRNTVAWYCEGLGLGRSAGLHWRHTDRPHGTVTPHRMHRSYRRFTLASLPSSDIGNLINASQNGDRHLRPGDDGHSCLRPGVGLGGEQDPAVVWVDERGSCRIPALVLSGHLQPVP